MLKLAGCGVLLLCILYLILPPHYQYFTVVERKSGEATNAFISESILYTERSVQGFIIAEDPDESCSDYLGYHGRTTAILLIPTSGCHFQKKLLYATREAYSVALFYDDESHVEIDISTLPRIEMEYLRRRFDYIGKISLEDAISIKNAYTNPKLRFQKLRFHGVIDRHDGLVDMKIKIYHLHLHSSKFYVVLFLSLIFVLLTAIHFWKRKTTQIETREIPTQQFNRVAETEEPDQVADQSDVDFCDDFCSICRQIIDELKDSIITLPCKHYYHSDCIDEWFQHNKQHRCPVCRYRVTSADKNFEHLSDQETDDELEDEFPPEVLQEIMWRQWHYRYFHGLSDIAD